jgi:hypothetical protein
MGTAVVGFCWPDAFQKAEATVAIVRQALQEQRIPVPDFSVEYLGLNTFLGPHADLSQRDELNEVWVRVAIRTQDKRIADGLGRQFPWLALSGPPYMGGFHGITPASQLLGLWPTLVERELIEPRVEVSVVEVA